MIIEHLGGILQEITLDAAGTLGQNVDVGPIQKLLGAFAFGIAPEGIKQNYEMECVPTLRFQLEGTRCMVVASMAEVMMFMKKKGVPSLTPAKAALFLKMAPHHVLDQFVKEFLYSCVAMFPKPTP